MTRLHSGRPCFPCTSATLGQQKWSTLTSSSLIMNRTAAARTLCTIFMLMPL